MGSSEQAARRAYESSRWWRAILGALPAVGLCAAAAFESRTPGSALGFGGALFVTAAVLLWRGRPFNVGVLQGVAAGVLPLVLSLAANHGHSCASGHCSTWCVPACVTGGVLSAAWLSWKAHRDARGLPFFAGAAATCVLTGAMGCACVGATGVLALLAGFAVTSAPWVVVRAARP